MSFASLVESFNTMLSRLQREIAREVEPATDAAVARRNAVLHAIGRAVPAIIGTADCRAGTQELLNQLGAATGVSRVFLFEHHRSLDGGRQAQSCRLDWTEPGLAPMAPDPRFQNMPVIEGGGEPLDEWTQRLQAGEPIQLARRDATGPARALFDLTEALFILSVPIRLGDVLWGYLGFDEGKAERAWTATEIDLLRTAAALIGCAIKRSEAEAALARRAAVQDAITYAATRIVGAADWKLAMPELLSRLGSATDVSRVFVFEIHPAPEGRGRAQSCRFSWVAPGVDPLLGDARYQNDPIVENDDPQFDDWFRRRSRGEVVRVTLAQTTGKARRLFEQTHTCSMLSVPILVDGTLWGSLGFDDCRRERIWDDVEIDLLKTATALVSAAIERARADEKIRDRESQFVEAQRIAHVGSWELDFEADEVRWSDEGWRIFGLEPGRCTWSHAENLERIHPDDRARVEHLDSIAKQEGGAFDCEYRIVRPDGEVRIVHEQAEAMRDPSGRLVRLIGTVHDVTELKAAEAKLRQSEERYALAARGADVGLWDWDVVKDAAYFAPRVHEILGVSAQSLGGSIDGLFSHFIPDDRAVLQRYLDNRFAKQRRRFEIELRASAADGSVRWLIIRGLIVYAGERPVRLVGSLRDITERKRAQEELIRQGEALHQSEKMAMFGSLLAGVAHELNNPLSVVTGQTVLLQQTATDPAVAARAERIRSATERCARIVRTFLAMARQRRPEPKPVKLNGLVETALDLLAYQLRSAGVRVRLELAPDLPAVTADADQLQQVVTNLIVNARQALAAVPAPRILRIATRHDAAAQRVSLAVSDNGHGVRPDIRTKIFDPFFTTKPAGEGTGIGLSLCSSIMRSYGGEIGVSDTPGGGATFTIALPLRTDAAPGLRSRPVTRAVTGLRILIADDEREIAETLSEMLQSQGHATDIVSDGRAALHRALADDYDLILSDLRMPVLDGPGLHQALGRERPRLVSRLAFITGDTLSPEVQSFLAESGALCLEKPFLPEEVQRLVSQMTERNA